jgi:putative acetyltransferase
MFVRREHAGDVAAVRNVVADAFADPVARDRLPSEALLLDALRSDPGWIPVLSLVAIAPSAEVVGHVLCTRATIDGTPVLGLGPLSVRSDWQRRGVGESLMHSILGAADVLGEPLVCLLGSRVYYARFGFRPASEAGISAPDPAWGEHFQFRPLSDYRPVTGAFAYARPFDDV